ncbi:MAG: DUF1207 domain-containing protein [Phycisphaeraceae bacterium]
MTGLRSIGAALFVVVITSASWAVETIPVRDDAYLTGYAQAVVDQTLGSGRVRVSVRAGSVHLPMRGLSEGQIATLRAKLEAIDGVTDVALVEEEPPRVEVTAPNGGAAATNAVVAAPVSGGSSGAAGPGDTDAPPDEAAPPPFPHRLSIGWFPDGHLFEPLSADPRWPNFGAAYTHYIGEDLKSVATVSFGADIVFYRGDVPDGLGLGGQYEFVLQPGVFGVFDLDASSADLQNADYFIGGGVAWRNGNLSAIARIFHQSSHIGDEFILANPAVTRVNLSYEVINALISYDFDRQWRLYGGAGVIIDQDPRDFGQFVAEYGLEWRSPWSFRHGWIRPVAFVDVKHWEENHWSPDISLRGGIEIANPHADGHRFQLLVEFFNGNSPNGQFYPQAIRYVGLGLHWYY